MIANAHVIKPYPRLGGDLRSKLRRISESIMSELKARIESDMKDAMRAKDALRLGTIRMLLAGVKQREVDERIILTDADVLKIINKQIKQRRDSISQFREAARHDLADKEVLELAVLEGYLPEALSKDEINVLIKQAIADNSATSIKDMGKVMAALKPQLEGKADMAVVSQLIKTLLN